MLSNDNQCAVPSQHDTSVNLDDCPDLTISAITEGKLTRTLSRYADDVWDLSPYVAAANTGRSETLIKWGTLPAGFVPGVKAVLYRYWMTGRPGGVRPTASSVRLMFLSLRPFLNWMSKKGPTRLARISAIHCMAWVHHCREQNLAPRSQKARYAAVEALHVFRGNSADSLEQHPWPEASARRLSGVSKLDHTVPSTKLIPTPDIRKLFVGAMSLIERADQILQARDNGTIRWNHPDPIALRSACYVIVGITSGCRNQELASIEEGAVRQTIQDGETFWWLKGISLKTRTGVTEWLIPELAARCVAIMERWAAPLRTEVDAILASLDKERAAVPPASLDHARLLNERKRHDALRRRLFLGRANDGSIGTVTGSNWRMALRTFAQYVGSAWPLAPHQLRRTFAANVAAHVMGDLIYLKHHYKHWSMDMTALYARNEQQEQELFDEVLHAVREKKISVIEHWLDDDFMITGGAAKPIKAFRAKQRLNILKTKRELAEDTADLVRIRATGHGWCLASDSGCGGQGLYEPTKCNGCRNGAIDSSHIPVWKNIYAQQLELKSVATDCGPGGQRRIARDVAHARVVLQELGVIVDEDTEQESNAP